MPPISSYDFCWTGVDLYQCTLLILDELICVETVTFEF
jgi:hypothetical protein